MKTALSMECARDIADVCRAWERGRISASKARGLLEHLVKGEKLRDFDPLELGGSEVDRVAWFVNGRAGGFGAAYVAEMLGMDTQRAREVLNRAVRQRRIERFGVGVFCKRSRT